MKVDSGVICFSGAWAARSLAATSISQTNSQGEEVVLQRDAIVTHTDSPFVVYKHFDLKEHRVRSSG